MMDNKNDDFILCGLKNVGNTCYMNAVLQIIINNKYLKKYFLSKEYETDLYNNLITKIKCENDKNILCEEITKTITFQLFKLIIDMKNNIIIEPKIFKYILGKKNNLFDGFDQNDGHDLLNFLLDSIHEETKSIVKIKNTHFPREYHAMNNVIYETKNKIDSTQNLEEKLNIINKYNSYIANHQNEFVIYNGLLYCAKYIENNSSIVSKYFTGIYHSTVECGQCKNKTHSFECFTTVSLEIPKINNLTIYDCFDLFTKEEELIEENKYKCEKCHILTNSKKLMTFWHIPSVFFIQLKRFKISNNSFLRINDIIKFPLELNMSNYVCKYNKMKTQQIYELSGVIQHFGSMRSGHYIAFNRSSIDGFWYLFDDSRIGKCSSENIENHLITPASYILVYSRK